jgi:hypothetical protein
MAYGVNTLMISLTRGEIGQRLSGEFSRERAESFLVGTVAAATSPRGNKCFGASPVKLPIRVAEEWLTISLTRATRGREKAMSMGRHTAKSKGIGRHSAKTRSTKRLVLSGAVGLAGLATIGGVFANFTDTAAGGPEAIATGQVHIVLATPTGDNGSLTVGPINNLAEGDTVSRVVQLTNDTSIGSTGTTGLAAVDGLVLQSAVTGTNSASDIVTDTTNGLHVTVQSCATSPTETGGTSGPWTYACTGGFATVVNNLPLKTLDTAAQDITSSAPNQGSSTYYVVTVTLPTSYADAYSYNAGSCSTGGTGGVSEQLQNCSLSVTYNFSATQRAGAPQ